MNYNQDPLVVHTEYSHKQMRQFHCYVYRNLRYLFYFLAAVLLISSIRYIIDPEALGRAPVELAESYHNEVPLIIPVLIVVGFVVFIGIQSFGLLYTKNKHDELINNLDDGRTFYFRNSEIELNISRAEQENTSFSYQTFIYVAETKDMFYLFTGKNTAFLIDKQGFKKGTPDMLRDLLRSTVHHRKCKFLTKDPKKT